VAKPNPRIEIPRGAYYNRKQELNYLPKLHNRFHITHPYYSLQITSVAQASRTKSTRRPNRDGDGDGGRGRGRAARGGTYGDGGIDALDVALLDEDLHGLEAERLDLRLRERLAPLQLLDLPVQIRRPHLRRRRCGAVPPVSLPLLLPEASGSAAAARSSPGASRRF
jgi:hypothetical protein